MKWPAEAEDRDLLYFLAQSFRSQLLRDLPFEKDAVTSRHRELAHTGKALLKDLSVISLEIAQMVVAEDENGKTLPSWFLVEVVRDLPRLVDRKDGAQSKV